MTNQHDEDVERTGPMIVACQWNYQIEQHQLMFCELLCILYLEGAKNADCGSLMEGLTRSSPIGPAEHDEGGSLLNSVSLPRRSLFLSGRE